MDGGGNLYIADYSNNLIRKVTQGGTIATVAGVVSGACTGTPSGGCYNGDNIAATSAQLDQPRGIALDGAGNLYIADTGNLRVREVTPDGIIHTIAGTGTCVTDANAECYNGDNITATSAQLNNPWDVTVDGAGNLYISDSYNNRIRKVTPGGIITSVAGNGSYDVPGANGGFYNGDGIAATGAELYLPNGIAMDGLGNLYIADYGNARIRKVDVSDAPSLTFAGTDVGQASPSQDVTVLNLGNAPLNISQINTAANFSLAGSDTSCSTSIPLIAAANCILGVEFNPTVTGSISGGIVLTDNALNANGATQTIALQGAGAGATTATVTVGTSPAGLSFSVDGTAYTTTQTLTWTIGSSHSLTTSAQSGAGTQYSFSGWSDGTATLTDSVTALAGATSYTAAFNASAYLLSVVSNNTSYGTVTAPAASGGYYPAATQVTLTAAANAGYNFSVWTGSADIASTSSANTTITMNGPETVTANFAPTPSYVVTTATDDSTGTASNCTPGGSNCSLRDALAAASAAGAGNITFSSSAFPAATTIQLTSGAEPPVEHDDHRPSYGYRRNADQSGDGERRRAVESILRLHDQLRGDQRGHRQSNHHQWVCRQRVFRRRWRRNLQQRYIDGEQQHHLRQ